MGDTRLFIDKYEKSGFIGRYLVNNFFNQLCRLIPVEIKDLIEIGCGAGYSTSKIKGCRQNLTIEASDIDEELISLAKQKNPSLKFTVESIYNLSLANQSHEAVISLEVLEHLERPRQALKELIRVSKKYIIISVPNEPLWRILNMTRGKYWINLGNTPGHINHWSEKSFKKLLGPELEIIKIIKPCPWLIVLAQKNDQAK